MKPSIGFGLVLLVATTSFAQDQEHKLIDRLLRPDMELKNDAQNKKFVADRTSVNKKADVGAFYVQQKTQSKEFAGTKEMPAREYVGTGDFATGKRQANTSSRNEIVNAQTQVPTRSTSKTRAVHDSNRVAQNGTFADQRPFLDKGKSQKSLEQPTKPMTIDEIRELLNKNK